jgi:hypothetical protein
MLLRRDPHFFRGFTNAPAQLFQQALDVHEALVQFAEFEWGFHNWIGVGGLRPNAHGF